MKVNFGNIIDNKSLHLPFSLALQSCSTSKVKFFVVKQHKEHWYEREPSICAILTLMTVTIFIAKSLELVLQPRKSVNGTK